MRKTGLYTLICVLGIMGCTVPLLMRSEEQKYAKQGDMKVSPSPTGAFSVVPWYVPPLFSEGGFLFPSPGPLESGFGVIGSAPPGIPGTLTSVSPSPYMGIFTPTPSPFISPYPFAPVSGSPPPVIVYSGPPVIFQGKVLGFNPQTATYWGLSNTNVLLNNSINITSNSDGSYASTQQFTQTTSVSAAKEGYFASTVDNVPPGTRDIHLYPLNEQPPYSDKVFTFTGKVTDNQGLGKYTMVVFRDNDESSSAVSSVDKDGKYSISVRPKMGKTTTTGTIMTYTMETVNNELTQIVSYGFSPYMTVPTPIPTPTPAATGTPDSSSSATPPPVPPNELMLSYDYSNTPTAFGEINVKLNIPPGLASTIFHVYMTLPTGAKFFVGKYVDRMGSGVIQKSIKVPSILGASFTLQAHCGTSDLGSDIIIPKLLAGDTVDYTFLSPPGISSPSSNDVAVSLTPNFSWSSVGGAGGYQLEVTPADKNVSFGWEAYTPFTSMQYPSFTNSAGTLKNAQRYYLQVMATDFDFGSLQILSFLDLFNPALPNTLPVRVKHYMDKKSKLPAFTIMLADPRKNAYPRGYRVTYRTIPFTTN